MTDEIIVECHGYPGVIPEVADIVDKATRSRMMSGIRGKNTRPELLIRQQLHKLGFRFRLHVKTLPGKPDIVLPKYRTTIFVHGCFWHGHDCHLFRLPSTRPEFWENKIRRNREIDDQAISTLRAGGWRVIVIWECALKGRTRLGIETVILHTRSFLENGAGFAEIRGYEPGPTDPT